MLDIYKLSVFHNDLQVIWNVNFTVQEGELVALIGSNGAGKTSMVETIFGLNRNAKGEIRFMKENIMGLPPYEIVRRGLALVPERREIFSKMSVRENLELGAYIGKDMEEMLVRVYDLFPILKERTGQLAGTLSGGEQQMLAIGRSLMSEPRLLVLDEPSSGLSPIMVSQVFEALKRLKEEGVTILLLEQNVWKALELANWGYVLENGRISLVGKASDLLKDEYVRTAYLGI
jgi:branched-chain amino acid transport system ATP-binding protein